MIEQEKIELREQAMQELLGDPPRWLISWGITIFFGIIATLLVGSYFFRYPEKITAPIQITTEQPACWVIPKVSGRIDSVFVENNSHVSKDDVLAYLGCSTNYSDILELHKLHNDLSVFLSSYNPADLPRLDVFLEAGELQGSHSALLKSINEYKSFYEGNLHQIKIDGIQRELVQQKAYLKNLKNQVDIRKNNLFIIHKQYKRDSLLLTKKMISESNFEKSQQIYLMGNIELNQSKMLLNSTQINISKLEQNINEYSIDFNNQKTVLQSNVFTAYDQLKAMLNKWEETYVLKSPADGIINFSTVWSKNQNVNAIEKVFCIIPDEPGKIIGKIAIPMDGAGKIKQGQNVIIKLDSYPYMEFGMLNGKVSGLVSIPNEIATSQGVVKFLTVEVSFPVGFTTTYQEKIPFNGELTGIADISTKDISLLEHLVSPLKYLWSRF